MGLVDDRLDLVERELLRAGVSPCENTPPVAQILMTWAPYLWSWRTIWRPASGLSITAGLLLRHRRQEGKNVESQWPPVAPIA